MKLRDLMTEVELQVKKASDAFATAALSSCREYLCDLFNLLDDELGSEAQDKCKSAESSKP